VFKEGIFSTSGSSTSFMADAIELVSCTSRLEWRKRGSYGNGGKQGRPTNIGKDNRDSRAAG
jgi:hypothetical protein